jgi:hypothetical protein
LQKIVGTRIRWIHPWSLIVLHVIGDAIIPLKHKAGATLLVEEKGDVSRRIKIFIAHKDIVPSRECFCAVTVVTLTCPSADEPVPLAVESGVHDGDVLPSCVDDF